MISQSMATRWRADWSWSQSKSSREGIGVPTGATSRLTANANSFPNMGELPRPRGRGAKTPKGPAAPHERPTFKIHRCCATRKRSRRFAVEEEGLDLRRTLPHNVTDRSRPYESYV